MSRAIYVKCKMRGIDGSTPIQNRSLVARTPLFLAHHKLPRLSNMAQKSANKLQTLPTWTPNGPTSLKNKGVLAT